MMSDDKKIIPLCMLPAGLIETFLYYGAEMSSILMGTGISELSLARRDVRISYLQQCRLIQNGLEACGMPGLGLLAGMRQSWCYSGSLGGAIDSSVSLSDAKAAYRRYALIAQPHYQHIFAHVDYFVGRNATVYSLLTTVADFEQNPELARFELEFLMSVMTRIYDSCGSKDRGANPVVVGFNFPEPVYAELFQQLPCAAVNFGTSHTYIAAPQNFVFRRWRPLRAHCFEKMMRQCETEYVAAGLSTSHADKVRWYVGTHFDSAQTIEDVARAFSLSSRALSRRLALEGTSFRMIFQSVKMELVRLHTRHSSLRYDEIAGMTGFSSSSSLRRAVKAFRETTVHPESRQ